MLAAGPRRTAWSREYPFPLERCCEVLVYEGILNGGRGAEFHEHRRPYLHSQLFHRHLLLFLHIKYIVELQTFVEYHQDLIQSSGKA